MCEQSTYEQSPWVNRISTMWTRLPLVNMTSMCEQDLQEVWMVPSHAKTTSMTSMFEKDLHTWMVPPFVKGITTCEGVFNGWTRPAHVNRASMCEWHLHAWTGLPWMTNTSRCKCKLDECPPLWTGLYTCHAILQVMQYQLSWHSTYCTRPHVIPDHVIPYHILYQTTCDTIPHTVPDYMWYHTTQCTRPCDTISHTVPDHM